MHLLRIQAADHDTSPVVQVEYHVGTPPPYAILSQRWGLPADEVTFQDLAGDMAVAKQKKGYARLETCCVQALEYGLTYAWIDTYCIDKANSAELSEAINSMCAWYKDAVVCFAYLEDVPSNEDISAPDSAFRWSSWFTRGWTLQELIAPPEMLFFAGDWSPRTLGRRSSLAVLITEITQIPQNILVDRNGLATASVVQKMSWASRRMTTRIEDEAYSLMGLFNVHMPAI